MSSTGTTTETPRTLPPGDLVIEANVRAETKITKEFVSSIRQHGIQVPVSVERVDDEWRVIDGQRRVLAALAASLTEVPVHVVDRTTEAGRLIAQLVVNDHREALTEADHTRTFQQLALFGVTADQIARKTNTPKKRVETALAVANSEPATAVLSTGNVTLDQAAALVEFQDTPDVVEYLMQTAIDNPAQFDHAVARAADARAQERMIAEHVAELEAAGWTVFTEEPDKGARLRDLFADVDNRKKYNSLASSGHETCTGRAVVVYLSSSWINGQRTYAAAHYEICSDWEANEHIPSWRSGADNGANGGGLTEEQKAERKLTRDNNKLWAPATQVRIAWIQQMLQQKDLPAQWETLVARFVARSHLDRNPEFAMKLLGVTDYRGSSERWLSENPTKAVHFLIAMALAAVENSFEFPKSGWRRENAPEHLAQLSRWGYALSELEEQVAKKASKK